MVVPISKFVNVKVSISKEGVVPKDFSTPAFISDKIQFKDSTKTFATVSGAKDLEALITYNGVDITDSSEIYIALQKLTANGINKIVIADIGTSSATPPATGTINDIATSLDKLKLAVDFFYIIASYRDADNILKIAEWAESNETMFFTSTNDDAEKNSTNDITITTGGTLGSQLFRKGYNNTVCIYSKDIASFPEAGWVGARGIEIPGDSIWAYADLPGIIPDNLTSGEYDNLLTRKLNAFISTGGKRLTTPGTVASGEWIDKIIDKFYIKARVQEEIFDLITSKKKIPYTEAGIALVASRFNKILDSLSIKILDQYQITIPRLSDLTATKIQSRELNISAIARLKGAIQTASFSIELSVGDIFNG